MSEITIRKLSQHAGAAKGNFWSAVDSSCPQKPGRLVRCLSAIVLTALPLIALPMITGCSTDSDYRGDPRVGIARTPSQEVYASAEESDGICHASGRLEELRNERMRDGDSYDYPVGPGDVLQVTIADLPEIQKLDARVDGQGMISLPLIGDIPVAGLTEDEVQKVVTDKDRRFQPNPRVHIFAQHFASRNVQVMGMVSQPGSYTLTGPDESILSVLGRAGGTKAVGDERASERVVLFPALSHSPNEERARELAVAQACENSTPENGGALQQGMLCRASESTSSDVPGDNPISTSTLAPGQLGASVTPIIVDLSDPTMTACLDIPARPGDIVLVPPAGQVGVYGWVARPGSFQVTAGMTVLGAITAAGGTMFSSNAEILRTVQGSRVSIPVDISDVEKGRAADPQVQGGDVVLVRASVLGAVPYAAYTLMNKFSTGLFLAPAGL